MIVISENKSQQSCQHLIFKTKDVADTNKKHKNVLLLLVEIGLELGDNQVFDNVIRHTASSRCQRSDVKLCNGCFENKTVFILVSTFLNVSNLSMTEISRW